MRVRDIMAEDVVTVTPDATVAHAVELLADNGFTALPVVDDRGDVVGVVTEVDVITTRYPHDARYLHLPPVMRPDTVRAVMTPEVFTVDADTDLADAAEQMWRHRHRCAPVLSGNRLVGVVTRRDLVRAMARETA